MVRSDASQARVERLSCRKRRESPEQKGCSIMERCLWSTSLHNLLDNATNRQYFSEQLHVGGIELFPFLSQAMNECQPT